MLTQVASDVRRDKSQSSIPVGRASPINRDPKTCPTYKAPAGRQVGRSFG